MIVREYTVEELSLPTGTEILSATFPFNGDKLELTVRTPDEPYDMRQGFDEDGQGFLFSAI